MKIFTDAGNVFSLRVLASCYATNTTPTLEIVDRKYFKIPGFCGKLPIVEVKPGKYLFNHNAATCYTFDQAQQVTVLSGDDRSKIDELIEWDAQKLQPAVLQLLTSHILNSKKDASSYEFINTALSTVNTLLENKQYLVGSSLSAADAIIWGSLYGVMQLQEIKDSSSKYSSLTNWYNGLSQNESFKKAVEKVTGGEGVSAFKASLEAYNALPSHQKIIRQSRKDVSSDNTTPLEEGNEITLHQIQQAEQEWKKGSCGVKPRVYEHPILPIKGERNVLITAALPYVNNVPHLGNIIGCVLSADVYARYCRLRNYNVLYTSGTDEYGTATETKALAEGVSPQEICDKYNRLHNDIYKWFNISFDFFGRTSTALQTKIAQDIFWKIHKNGYFLEDTVDQLQCVECKRFLADRFVEGTCPYCKYEDARGDQCDACGKLINAVDLINPKCKQCGSSPILRTSKHVFIDLPKIEPQLRDWLKKKEGDNWTQNSRQITKGWLADGLKPRCITRDLKWGTPVPLEGYTDKVFYVWFDAPIGYISITANYTDQWEKWWKNPDEVEYVQFMAKDNVPFHTVVFPSSLLAANDNYTLMSTLSATEYLNYEDDKFSKSRGVGVFGDHAESTGIPADIFRFYLLFVRPETSDSAFQWSDLALTNNSELLNNLGNFVNRALMFMKNSFNSTMPELHLKDEEYKLIASVNMDLTKYIDHLEKLKLRDAVRFVLNMSRAGNQYIQGNQPWVLAKGTDAERVRAGTVIGLSAQLAALITILIQPYMPDMSAKLQSQLAFPAADLIIPKYFVPILPTGHKIGVPYPLFQKIDPAVAEELRQRFVGKRDEKPAKGKDKDGAKTVKPDAVVPNTGPVDPAKVAELESLVAQQGEVVREAKTVKASKDVIDVEVKKLLALKESLAIAQGIDPKELKKGKSKKKK